MARVAASLAAVLAVSLALVACGGDGAEPDAPEGADATLVLDFQPNAVHAPLYSAQESGYFDDEGLDLDIREPSTSADGAKLLQAGRADLAIMDVNDLGIARERGAELVAVAAIVQRPLASVIAGSPDRVRTPRDLDGAAVGVSGVPSDDAVLDTVLESGGLAPDSVDRVTIGFNAVPAVASGKVAAATAFWNAEGVQLAQEGVPTRQFRVDELGAPRYPELVLVARGDGVPSDQELVCRVLRGLGRSYIELRGDPQPQLEAMLDEVDGLDADSQRGQFAELIAGDAFSPSDGSEPDAALTKRGVAGWEGWARERGLVSPEADLTGAFQPGAVRACAKAG